MKTINICFITDDGYATQTCVAITSILMNKNKNTIYDIFVLCVDVTAGKINKLESISTSDLRIHIIRFQADTNNSQYKIEGISANPTALYKFQIPDILSHLDKVLYLDGDLIVKCDLSELYNTDIGDNYVGGVKDIMGSDRPFFHLCINHIIKYINSGVMLMNLRLMREKSIPTKLMEYRKNGYNEYMDQDALNMVLRHHIYEIPYI